MSGVLLEKEGPHSHEVVLVSIADKSEATGELYISLGKLLINREILQG